MINEEKKKTITLNTKMILEGLPSGVTLVAAAKTRTPEAVKAVIEAGVLNIGENYIQEAEKMVAEIGDRATWHFIGHLQKNKVKKAVRLFDIIETVDSISLAEKINRECEAIGKTISILVEINSGREESKDGVFPEDVDELVKKISELKNIKIKGLMTMGPLFGDPEDARPYFKETKRAFDRLAGSGIPNIEMKYLSMGMSNSYKVAIEEGTNIIRIGTKIFGPR
jgi:PLP dependent protein